MLHLFSVTILLIFKCTLYSQELENYKNYKISKNKYNLIEIYKGLDHPFGLSFMDEKNLLITEKGGKLMKINTETGISREIKHTIPSVKFNNKSLFPQQGGLLDVYFNTNDNLIYFTYSHQFKNGKGLNDGSSTAIARGKLVKDKIENFQILLLAHPKEFINKHWGSRILIKNDYLYAGFGDRDRGNVAQDSSNHLGSIVRIHTNGTLPKQNPAFSGYADWLPEIFLIGVRNPQGIAISPKNDEIFFSQHGPKGGDNISKVSFGANYGWKKIAWGGTEYSGKKIGKSNFDKKFEKPLKVWVPSIAVGSINFYSGETFREWEGDLIVSATKTNMLLRLDYSDGNFIDEEIILKDKIGRIRDFTINNEGDIFIIVDEKDSSLWKLTK